MGLENFIGVRVSITERSREHLTSPAGVITKYQSSDIRDSAIRTFSVLCQPALLFFFLIQRRNHPGKWVSRMQCRQHKEDQAYAILVSSNI